MARGGARVRGRTVFGIDFALPCRPLGHLNDENSRARVQNVRGDGGKLVAQLMGHTNADVTINVYTQVLDASLRTAVDCIGGELLTIVHLVRNRVGAKSLFVWLLGLDSEPRATSGASR